MGMTALQVQIMPESLETSLEKLKGDVEEKKTSVGGKITEIKEEPIAFGLKALIATIAWPESLDTDLAENTIQGIEGVSSTKIIDYRRAFG